MQQESTNAVLVVLSGDAALAARIESLAGTGGFRVIVAADPEAARKAQAQYDRLAVILLDQRGARNALYSAIPVLKRQGAVLALVDAVDGGPAAAALDAGAVDAVAESDLSAPLIRHLIRHALSARQAEERQKKTRLDEPVIGIPSQVLFWEILSLAVRRSQRNRDFFAVLLLDFNNLPDGDCAEGPYRDLVLKDLVARIRPILRSSDTIARLETQQLAILVEAMPRVEDVQIVAEKIIEETEAQSDTGGSALDLAIGIALFPTSAQSAEEMLARATDAMLLARERGRNLFAFG